MRRLASATAAAVLLWSLSFAGPPAVAAPAEPAAPQAPTVTYPLPDGVRFLHTVTPSNTIANYTLVSNPASDNLTHVLLFATHNYNPGASGGQYDDHALGTDFHNLVAGLSPAGVLGKWGLYHEDEDGFADGLAYNVMVTPEGDRAFVHTSAVSNTVGDGTVIDHPWLNERLDRIPFILHNYSPNGVISGLTYTHTVGVYYDEGLQRWLIFNEDEAPMPINIGFNVMVALPGSNVFTHTATGGDTFLNFTVLDHPLSNGNPAAQIIVTQNWNPAGGSGVYNDHRVGVFYDTNFQKWVIYNEDSALMPIGASFSVLIDYAHIFMPIALR